MRLRASRSSHCKPTGPYNRSMLAGAQVREALLAIHLNGERVNLDHGYPLRWIVPNRPGVHRPLEDP